MLQTLVDLGLTDEWQHMIDSTTVPGHVSAAGEKGSSHECSWSITRRLYEQSLCPVLYDMFDIAPTDVATTLGREPAAVRQFASVAQARAACATSFYQRQPLERLAPLHERTPSCRPRLTVSSRSAFHQS